MIKTQKYVLVGKVLGTWWSDIPTDMKHKLLHLLNPKTYFKSESVGPSGSRRIHSALLPCWGGKKGSVAKRMLCGFSGQSRIA